MSSKDLAPLRARLRPLPLTLCLAAALIAGAGCVSDSLIVDADLGGRADADPDGTDAATGDTDAATEDPGDTDATDTDVATDGDAEDVADAAADTIDGSGPGDGAAPHAGTRA